MPAPSRTVTDDELDDLVEEWHNRAHDTTGLREFIAERVGWTIQDVERWVADASYRPE